MKWKLFIGLIGTLLAVTLSIGETVTATSNAFSFPDPGIGGVKDIAGMKREVFFNYRNFGTSKGIVSIAWSLPENIKANKGTISVYTLLGKCVEKFPIESQYGTVNWKVSEENIANGVYFARIKYGSFKKNLKMILFN